VDTGSRKRSCSNEELKRDDDSKKSHHALAGRFWDIDMTGLVLFDAPQSTCSQRVRFVLQAKRLVFEERKLDLFAGDQLKPEYLAINPNGVVPSLLHEGRAVVDSSVIMEYLDEVFPDPERLVPDDPVERAKMRALMRFIDEVPAAAIRVPSYNLAL